MNRSKVEKKDSAVESLVESITRPVDAVTSRETERCEEELGKRDSRGTEADVGASLRTKIPMERNSTNRQTPDRALLLTCFDTDEMEAAFLFRALAVLPCKPQGCGSRGSVPLVMRKAETSWTIFSRRETFSDISSLFVFRRPLFSICRSATWSYN